MYVGSYGYKSVKSFVIFDQNFQKHGVFRWQNKILKGLTMILLVRKTH